MKQMLKVVGNKFIFFQPSLLFFITLSFAGGIILAKSSYFYMALCALLPLGLLSFLFYKRVSLLLVALFFSAGAFRLQWSIEAQNQFFSQFHNKEITIHAYVTDSIKTSSYPFCTRLKVRAIKIIDLDGNLHTGGGSFFVYTNNKSCAIGDTIVLHKVMCKKPPNESFLSYLRKEDIKSAIFCFKSAIKKIEAGWSFKTLLPKIRNHVFTELSQKIDPKTFALFATIFFGNRAAVKNELVAEQKLFAKWGIVHFLARSGLHVLILILLWSWILSLLSCSHASRLLLLTGFVFLYGLLSWSSISFIRALLMFFCYQVCIVARLPIQTLHLLSLVALLVLALNPVHIFFLDFQLSFGLTFLLAWIALLRAKKRILGIC